MFENRIDGGAVAFETGTNSYYFGDGSKAWVAVLPTLHVDIEFPNGARVSVRQQGVAR